MRSGGRRGTHRRRGAGHAIDVDGARDVLQGLLADVLKTEIELSRDLVVDGRRDADAARVGHGLEARGDVDAVAQQVFVLDHHIAEIDADPKVHLAMFRQRIVARLEGLLDFHGAAHRLDDARELREHRIARGAHDAALMKGDDPVDHRAVSGEHPDRAFFIVAHLPAVSGGIGRKDACQPALYARWIHGSLTARLGAARRRAPRKGCADRSVGATSAQVTMRKLARDIACGFRRRNANF